MNNTKKDLLLILGVATTLIVSCSIVTKEPQTKEPTPVPLDASEGESEDPTEVAAAELVPSTQVAIEQATDVPGILSDIKFDPATANQEAPEDVLKEILFFGGGGGVRCSGNEERPTITYEPLDGELMTLSTMIVCGLEKGEDLQGTIRYPDGSIVIQEVVTDMEEGLFHALLGFRPGINDPPGMYTYVLSAASGTVEATVKFTKPSGPRLFRLDDAYIFLYGFRPKESVRLFYYQKPGLNSWDIYRVDSNGQLTIQTLVDNVPYSTYFFAIGDESGEVRLLQEDYWGRSIDWVQQKSIQKRNCSSLVSRLSIGDQARVAFTDGADMRIRENPSINSNILHKVPEGTVFVIEDGPMCLENIIWWKVNTDKNLKGWMAEYLEEIYLLEPVP